MSAPSARPVAAKRLPTVGRTATTTTKTTSAAAAVPPKGSKPQAITKRNAVVETTTTTTITKAVLVENGTGAELLNGDAPAAKAELLMLNGNGESHEMAVNGNGHDGEVAAAEGQKMVIDLTAD